MRETDKIVAFYTLSDWPSNFYPFTFTMDNLVFSSSEQAFMYLKAVFFKDMRMATRILKCHIPAFCKVMGRNVKGFVEEVWANVRDDMMRKVIKAKFAAASTIRTFLLATKGKILVEASQRDRYWGAGLSKFDDRILDPDQWRGENRLGDILMEERDSLLALIQ